MLFFLGNHEYFGYSYSFSRRCVGINCCKVTPFFYSILSSQNIICNTNNFVSNGMCFHVYCSDIPNPLQEASGPLGPKCPGECPRECSGECLGGPKGPRDTLPDTLSDTPIFGDALSDTWPEASCRGLGMSQVYWCFSWYFFWPGLLQFGCDSFMEPFKWFRFRFQLFPRAQGCNPNHHLEDPNLLKLSLNY